MIGRILLLSTVLVLTAACGGGSAAPATAKPPPGVKATVLGSGRLEALPPGALFVNYLDLPQVAAASLKHKHGAGFVYGVQGTHELDIDGAGQVLVQPGQAAFVGANVMHSHVNPSTVGDDWWFVALRSSASRPLPTVVPGQKELYTTGDLSAIAAGAYMETLTDGRLPAKGVDHPASTSLQVLYVMDGSLTVSGDAMMAGNVGAGSGTWAGGGANLTLSAGSAGAHYLVFSLTPSS
jgi:quercetin dioxygenase-like cupin family protein